MKTIIATVGPSLLHKLPLNKIHKQNIIYRINGAHGNINSIEKYIQEIKHQISDAKILIDLPGNKIRTANFEYGFIELEEGKEFDIYFHQFNYKNLAKYIKINDIVLANDSVFKFKVKNIDYELAKVTFISYSNGKLLNNKGFHIKGINQNLPFFFAKDKDLISLSNKYNIDYIGLSFVRNKKDILESKKLIKNSKIIAKIETLSAVNNLDSILEEIEYILIDRGDLSTDVGLLEVPKYQNHIIKKALFANKKIFLATQFLKTMEYNPIPTFAEIIDLYNTLNSGIYGVQLSEETAVGKYPKETINTIQELINNIKG